MNHQQQESESESLLRYGHSKDKRPDLLQYRQMLGTLDPAGIPLVSATLAGNGADDPIYYPTWQKMAKVIGHNQFVLVADCKAGAIATRAQIANEGGIYCFPLPMTGQHPELLKQWVLAPPADSVEIRLPRQDMIEPAVGKGFDVELGKFWLNPGTGKWVRWNERYLVVYSDDFARATIIGLQQRIDQATASLNKLAAKPGDDLEQLSVKVETILKRCRVKELFVVTTATETITETRYIGRGRPTAKSPTQQITRLEIQLHIQPQSTAIEQALKLAGWRLYVTNASTERLTLPQAVIYYRDEWLLERSFHRVKRGHLPALPIYFQPTFRRSLNRIDGYKF